MNRIILLVFLFLSQKVISQETLKEKYILDKVYEQSYIDSILDKKLRLYSIADYRKMLQTNSELLGWPYYYSIKSSQAGRKEDHDSVIYYAKQTIQSYQDARIQRPIDEKSLILAYNNWARSLTILKDYKNSLQLYQHGLDLTKKYPYKWKSFLIGGLADNHMDLGNDSLALMYYTITTKDEAYMKIDRSAVTTYKNMASIFEDLKKNDSAKYYLRKAIERMLQSDYKTNLSATYGGLGYLFEAEKNTDSAFYYFDKALKTNNALGIPQFYGALDNHEIYKGYVNVYNNNLEEAYHDLSMLLNEISGRENVNKGDKGIYITASNLIARIFQKRTNLVGYEKILEDRTQFIEKFYQQTLEENLQALEIQYQTKEKDISIAQLTENEAQQNKIIQQQKIITLGLAGLSFLLVGFGFLFFRQRKLKNQYIRENLEQRLLRSQMNPHFVANAINTACALVDRKSDDTISYLNKLSGLFRLTLINSREELVHFNDEITALKYYLDLQSGYANKFDYTIEIDEIDEIVNGEFIIPPMLIQPFVENAIVHGFPKKQEKGEILIKFMFLHSEKLLRCVITDNGVGYEMTGVDQDISEKPSVSSNIVRERLAILKKKFKVNTRLSIQKDETNKGTVVEIFIPFFIDN